MEQEDSDSPRQITVKENWNMQVELEIPDEPHKNGQMETEPESIPEILA